MRIFGLFLIIIGLVKSQQDYYIENTPVNNCIEFTVNLGTGCAWMCSYCANNLNTNNYYFIDGVCTYQIDQGCVGNPISGKLYTCCSA